MEEERWILVSDGTAQTLYAGMTKLSEEEVDLAIQEHRPVELRDCRVVRTVIMPLAQGGITQNEFMTPVSVARSSARVKVMPQAYFWPDEDETTMRSLQEKLGPAKEAEAKHRAAEAGIVTNLGQRPPGGKLLS